MTSRDSAALTARSDPTTVAALGQIIAASGCRAIAVIGLAKNAGKTTVVNALLDACRGRFGLTSLGLDGEASDHLTGLAKPRIVPPAGTLVATTRGSLDRSRYALHELGELPYQTPLGHVVIGRAGVGGGAVEVSGPTTLAELATTVRRLEALGAEQVLVDGAINRLGGASPRVSDGVIVATGGTVGESLEDVVEATAGAIEMLTLPQAADAMRALANGDVAAGARAAAVVANGSVVALELETVIGEGVAVAREVERLGAHTLLLQGAVTQELVDDLARVLPPRRQLRVIVRDATMLIVPPATVIRFARRGLSLEVLTPLRVLALTVNPFRLPQPYQAHAFFAAIADVAGDRVPVFDVVRGLSRLPGGHAEHRPARASTTPREVVP